MSDTLRIDELGGSHFGNGLGKRRSLFEKTEEHATANPVRPEPRAWRSTMRSWPWLWLWRVAVLLVIAMAWADLAHRIDVQGTRFVLRPKGN